MYDQTFHSGLNIIRGENSSGKSTIADFIFFALGGDFKNWTPEAANTDSVFAQVSLNGPVYTFSRDVQLNTRSPLNIFEGTLDEALRERDGWLRYPYSRTSNTESFSQVVFSLLGLPEQITDAQQNITLNQILRLMYVDQITSVEELFRDEQFDNRDIRTAVGELLLGIDDLEMHDIRLRLRNTEREYAEAVGELRSMFHILGQTDHVDISTIDFQEEIRKAQAEQEDLRKTVDELASQRAEEVSANADQRIRSILDTLRQTKERLAGQHSEEQSITFDLEDSRLFVATLEERLTSLAASECMVSVLGNIHFKICPACFQITETVKNEGICHLCKAPITDSDPGAGHLKMREELSFQLRESTDLIKAREVQLSKIRTRIKNLEQDKRNCETQLDSFQRSVHAVDAEIEIHVQKIGYLDRLIEDLNAREQFAELIRKRMSVRDELSQKLAHLRDELEVRTKARKKRTEMVKTRISELCVDILISDLPQEETFQNADIAEFDFAANKMRANERSRFSASSMTLLKNAMLFSMMRLSLEDDKVRWPRFLLLDNIEDKGMQPERSANFQELVEKRLVDLNIEHQVIMTTSMISPKLDGSPYCVGPFYKHDNKTLQFARAT